jgi:singapore isolate B (sub-type 7) whole genome shotgun sequence assembly, scaffold_4
MWISRIPDGPSVRFLLHNGIICSISTHIVHTTEELKMTGNCLMGSRPLLVFDKQFDSSPELQLLREMFKQVFGVPLGHPKSKPFVDHLMSFFVVDNKIWIRNYQISERGHTEHEAEKFAKRGDEPQLTEIGPRMVLEVIRIFDDSFTGKTLYENPNYVSPSLSRSGEKKKKTGSYAKRMKALERLQKREEENVLPEDELGDVFE